MRFLKFDLLVRGLEDLGFYGDLVFVGSDWNRELLIIDLDIYGKGVSFRGNILFVSNVVTILLLVLVF